MKASPDSRENQSLNVTVEEVAVAVTEIPSAVATEIIPLVEETDLNTHHVTATGNVRTAERITLPVIASVSDARKPHLQAPVESKISPHVKAIGIATIVAIITLHGEANVTSVRRQDREAFPKVSDGNRSEVAEEVAEALEEDAAEIEEEAEVASIRASNPAVDPTKKLHLIKL